MEWNAKWNAKFRSDWSNQSKWITTRGVSESRFKQSLLWYICIETMKQNETKKALLAMWSWVVLSEGTETDFWSKFRGIIESTPIFQGNLGRGWMKIAGASAHRLKSTQLFTHFFRGYPSKFYVGRLWPEVQPLNHFLHHFDRGGTRLISNPLEWSVWT